MDPKSITINFEQVAEQSAGPVQRINGFVLAREIIELLDAADLDANPRSAKAGTVTNDIIESITDTPDIFTFKTKGILLGASNFVKISKDRYRLSFINPTIEGILDGGHNTLAIGTHILICALRNNSIKRKIKTWPDFKEAWSFYRDEIEKLKELSETDAGYNPAALDFLVPIEILVPSNVGDDKILEQFNNSLLTICSARNNNAQLTLETKSNKKGFYEDLRQALPNKISSRVEWKSNDGGEIKVRDIISLTWIPLAKLKDSFDYIPVFPPQNIYRNKGECAKLFDLLMSEDEVSENTDGEYTRQLHNQAIKSAIELGAEIPELFDKIYLDFPGAYNENNGKFGKINIVKKVDPNTTTHLTNFTKMPAEYKYPDGLIYPIVYGLQSLMETDHDGNIGWSQDPKEFLDNHLAAIVKKYKVILDAFGFDPQKVGKNEGSYQLVMDAFKTEIVLQESPN